jgi:hypothetical protein
MCEHCNDTGSRSKDIGGQLDCVHCQAAQQRVELEAWYKAVKNQYITVDLLWLAFQRGQAEVGATN